MRQSEFIDDMGTVKPIPAEAKQAFKGETFSVWQWPQQLYDGSTKTFEAIKRGATAHTIGVLPDDKILLTEDAHPNREAVLTPPGGIVEEGESPIQAAKREFLEETGYAIGELIPWHHYRASTRMEWMIYAFVGRDLKQVAEPDLEPGEKIKLKKFTFAEMLELSKTTYLRDRILRIIFLQALLDEKKKQDLKNVLYG